MKRLTLAAAVLLPAAGCFGPDGHFELFGYTSRPNYDTSIRTVYVPQFANKVFLAGPYRGLEKQLTRAVIREIELRTPYKVISDPARADTELKGVVVNFTKFVLNNNQENEVRELQLLVEVAVVWYDYRTGKYLTNPASPAAGRDATVPFDPTVPVDGTVIPAGPVPARLIGTGRGIPEVGESSTTALKMAVDDLAVRVATMMEKPW